MTKRTRPTILADRSLDLAVPPPFRWPVAAGGHVTTHLELESARALQQQGRIDEAVEAYRRILQREQDNAKALHYLGLAYMQRGDLDQAISALSKSLQKDSSSATANCDLGALLVKTGMPREALAFFGKALSIDSQHTDALNNAAATLCDLNRPNEALPLLERLANLRPLSSVVWSRLGEVSLRLHRVDQAIEHLRQAIHLEPKSLDERVLLGEALESIGRFGQARFQYLTVLEQDRLHPIALARLLSLRDAPLEAKWVENAAKLLRDAQLEKAVAIRLHSALGQFHDRAENYATAFEHYQHSHALQVRTPPFSSAGFSAAVDRLIQCFTRDTLESLSVHGSDTNRPIFIVGMPRSGTTLTEQILASHSQVRAGGELPTIMNLASQIQALTSSRQQYPEAVRSLTATNIAKLSEAYLAHLAERTSETPRATDKLPFNFMHVGLIAALFPRATIIHCQRQPLDTCLSCYFVGFADELQFAHDLPTLGHYYKDYQRLIRHWHTVLPGRIYDVQYEELVTDTPRSVRGLLEHCGLDWEDACLRFYDTERHVRTPSRWQVRQPVYTNSIDRWRKYEAQLKPLSDILSQ